MSNSRSIESRSRTPWPVALLAIVLRDRMSFDIKNEVVLDV